MVTLGTAAAGPEQRLSELGAVLPSSPTPLGTYVEAVRSGNLVFFSGMLPVVERKPQFVGRVGGELTLEDGRKAAATATLNGLSAAKALLGSLDRVAAIAKLGVYIATEGDFRSTPGSPMVRLNCCRRSLEQKNSRPVSSSVSRAYRSASRSKWSSF